MLNKKELEGLAKQVDNIIALAEQRKPLYNSLGLKPCPFCGSYEVSFADSGYWIAVTCDNCGCFSRSITHGTDYCSQEKARELWNKRV